MFPAQMSSCCSSVGLGSRGGVDWPRSLSVGGWLTQPVLGLADALDRIDEAMRHEHEVATEVDGQLASVRATATVLATLPAVAVAMGHLLGARPVEVLFGTPIGAACLVLGAVLAAARLVVADEPGRVSAKDPALVSGWVLAAALLAALAVGVGQPAAAVARGRVAVSTRDLLAAVGSPHGLRPLGAALAVTVVIDGVMGLVVGSAIAFVVHRRARKAKSAPERALAARRTLELPIAVEVLASCLAIGATQEQALRAVAGGLPGSVSEDFARAAGALERWRRRLRGLGIGRCPRSAVAGSGVEPGTRHRCTGGPTAVGACGPAAAAGQDGRDGRRTNVLASGPPAHSASASFRRSC